MQYWTLAEARGPKYFPGGTRLSQVKILGLQWRDYLPKTLNKGLVIDCSAATGKIPLTG
jgi:hypothetical protein